MTHLAFLDKKNEIAWNKLRPGDFVWVTNTPLFYGQYYKALILNITRWDNVKILAFNKNEGHKLEIHGPTAKFVLISKIDDAPAP